jgi:hypothetical protein
MNELELLSLLLKLPLDYIPSISFYSSDAEGGYGWRRIPYISIHRVGEVCSKCGYSTIRNDIAEKEHRHSWRHDEVVVFSMKIITPKDYEQAILQIHQLIQQQ